MLDVGIRPPELFETELAGRLLGAPAVGLAALLNAKLGIRLRKAHSADNWAIRPLPTSWLIYAALDVDYLIELADLLRAELAAKNRMTWAQEEFVHILQNFSAPPTPRKEPWRRLSGIQGLKYPKQLAVARALWQERDRVARNRDRPPSRILTRRSSNSHLESPQIPWSRMFPHFPDSPGSTLAVPGVTEPTGPVHFNQCCNCPPPITHHAARSQAAYHSRAPGSAAIQNVGSFGKSSEQMSTPWPVNSVFSPVS